MRTRNAEGTKSGAKKTPQAKKDTQTAADKTPETASKAAPKAASGAKSTKVSAAKQQSTPKTTAAAADPKLETKAEEVPAPSEEKKPEAAAAAKSLEKKLTGKAKLQLGGKTAAVAKVEEAPAALTNEEVLVALKMDETPGPPVAEPWKEESREVAKDERKVELEPGPWKEQSKQIAKDEPETQPEQEDNPCKMEEDPVGKGKAAEGEQQEEYAEQEAFQGPGDEEFQEGEEGGEGDEGGDGEEGGGVEAYGIGEEEQMEISDMAKRRKIKKEQEIFVGGLDRDATEEDVKKAFEKIGEVEEVRLHKDFVTNKNKGYAFVKFASKEQASRALAEMKNPVIRGKRCGIAPSEDNDTLFLGNICNTWTKEAIKRKLKDYGVDGVESITLVEDTQNEGLSRGFAFLEFACHADAMLAYKRLQKPDVIFGHPERTAKVAFAEPLREPDAEVMAQVKSVFVDGLPPYWDEDRVKEQFKDYGVIERVVLARNMPTAKRKDFGFVNFTTHEAAVACVEGVSNIELGDGKSKMKARARLANPLPKTQAVKGGMRGGFRVGHTGLGTYSRFGRGFGRGRYFPHRAGFQGGRGFHLRGRGRGGRFSFAADTMESSYTEFRGRRPYGVRGGRRGSFRGAFEGTSNEFARHGKAFPSRRQPFPVEGDFGGPFGPRNFGDEAYLYGEAGLGIKRPFSMMEPDPSFLEPGNRLRPRYDHPDPMPGGAHYRDSLGMGGLYAHEYYGSDYAGSYSSLYGGEHSGGGYSGGGYYY